MEGGLNYNIEVEKRRISKALSKLLTEKKIYTVFWFWKLDNAFRRITIRGDKTKNINVYKYIDVKCKPPGKIGNKFFFIQFLKLSLYDFLPLYDFDHLSMFLCIVGIWECLELGGRRISHVVEWYSCRDGSLRCLHPPRSYEIRGKANGGTVLTRIQGKSSKIKLCPQVVIGRFEI